MHPCVSFVFDHKEAGSPVGSNCPLSESHNCMLCSMESFAKPCSDFTKYHHFIFFDDCSNILIFGFICCASYSTIVWLIGVVHTSIFQIFHLPFDTAVTEVDIFIHTPQISAAELFFIRNSVTAGWQWNAVTDRHFVPVDCKNTSGEHVPDLYLCLRGYMVLPTLRATLCGTNVIIQLCSWLLV